MKANELMIGDWVLCPDSSREHIVYVQIDAIEEGYGYSLLVTKQRSDWFVDVSEIQPIPLTTEILKNNFPTTEVVVWWPKISDDHKYIEYHCETRTDGDIMASGTFHYVHELQHALKLCGIEKEIEL